MTPDLETIRNPYLLQLAVREHGFDFAIKATFLKWSEKNREWLFERDNFKCASGLCYFFQNKKNCGNCVLVDPVGECHGRFDYCVAEAYSRTGNFKGFCEAADSFYSWMEIKVKSVESEKNE